MNTDELEAWLIDRLAQARGIDRGAIDVRERFSRYGLDSMATTRLVAELSTRLGRPLSPTLAWEYPTIEAVARHLGGGRGDEPPPPVTSGRAPRVSGEPVAIVGMAGRFPKAPDVAAFWRLLCGGVDAITQVPRDRWDIDALFDEDPSAPGKLSTRWGGFLDHVDGFDPQFFGISPREAAQIDPQQRLMLELAWEALEDAGIPPRSLKDSQTGVFVGAMWHDYACVTAGSLGAVSPHTATGQDLSIIPARISYTLGLRGPSVALNTACSSALVAVHYARRSLELGECGLALAGGVNLLLSPESTVIMSKFGAMAPDGRSKAFDSRANGYVRGEGGGVVVMKPLSRALADGDPVHCILLGSAVNNDGFSNGLTAPSPKAQELVLRDAYANAGVDPRDVHYVETHGTGTMLGDPIEAGSVGAVLGAGRPADRPLVLGAVKTNIGHLEAAAGAAGLIKTALALKHRIVPPNLHFREPNPHIPFDALRLRVPTSVEPWPERDGRDLAGVSAFGFGGTNCHVVLGGAPGERVALLPLAARDPEGLRRLAVRVRDIARDAGRTATLDALCGATATAADDGHHRHALLTRSWDELAAQVDRLLEGQPSPGALTGEARAGRPLPVFVFAGQGSQWLRMGADLLREPAFQAAIARCDRAMAPHLQGSIVDVLLSGDAAWLEDTARIQPAIFAVQVAVAALLRSLGVEPSAVVGQSMGEVAAACVAGCLSLDDAARVICLRSRIATRASGRGAMAVVDLPMDAAKQALDGRGDRLAIAVNSSPSSTVLSGDSAALEVLIAELERGGVTCRRIKVDYASHSPEMDPLLPALGEALAGVRPRRGSVPFYSTVTGDRLDGSALDAAYWCRNLREPVLFAETVSRLVGRGHDLFLEVDPHPLLVRSIEQCLAHAGLGGLALATMRRDEPGRAVLFEALGALYVRGHSLAWHRVYPAEARAGALLDALGLPARSEPRSAGAGAAALLPLSAHTPEALRDVARRTASFLRDRRGVPLSDVAYTAGVRRSHLAHRLLVLGRAGDEIAAELEAFARGEAPACLVHGEAKVVAPKVVFVFPGQGSQWVGMGRGLLEAEPVFREVIEACDAAIRREAGFSVIEELYASEARSRLGEIDVAQPILFAVEVALAALWRSWGVEPDAVVGHSMGEVAAAHVAGALTLEDAAQIICRRGRLLRRVSGQGAMAMVELSLESAQAELSGYGSRLFVAASNSPRATVISGEMDALEELLDRLESQGVFCGWGVADVASHSPQMEPLLADLHVALSGISPREASVPMRSTVTGERLRGDELSAGYWADNLRKPVLFSRVIRSLVEQGPTLFVEVSPHPILLPWVEQNLDEGEVEGAAIASLRRGQDERRSLLESLGKLYVRGCAVAWERLHPEGGRVVELPTYPWQRERYWLEAPEQERAVSRGAGARGGAGHPLLGSAFSYSLRPEDEGWEQEISVERLGYLSDHRVQGEVVFPGAGYVEMALAAGAERWGTRELWLDEVTFEQALVLPAQDRRVVQVVLSEEGAEAAWVQISSRAEGSRSWTKHAGARVRRVPGERESEGAEEPPRARAERLGASEPGAVLYERVREAQIDYGPAFQGVEEVWSGAGEAVARVRLPESVDEGGYVVHPALLDACLQVSAALFGTTAETVVPVGIERVEVHARALRQGWVVATRAAESETSGGERRCDVRLLDEEGRSLVEVRGLRLRRLEGALAEKDALEGCVHEVVWRRAERLPEPSLGAAGTWVVFSDRGGVGAGLHGRLTGAGQRCVRVFAGEGYEQIEPDLYRIDPGKRGDYARLLREAFGEEGSCGGVVHLFSLDAAPMEATTAEALAAELVSGSVSAAYLTQALVRHGFRDAPRLFLVTRGAQGVQEHEAVSVGQAPVWGLGRTIALEHPEVQCTRIDLAPGASEADAARLARELGAAGPEDQVALRGDDRYVARLVRGRFEAESARRFSLRPDASYLITGGLGGLGIALARWMVDRGARHLVLVGRRGPGEAARGAIEAMEAAGARVLVAQADVSRPDDTAGLLATLDEHTPLRGVVHAAAVLDDHTLLELDEQNFRRSFAPKALGAWNLHALTEGRELDFFVMYSSALSLFGSPGQANYTASNAFVDALSRERARRGLVSMSIQWGAFAEVGLAAADDLRGNRLSSRGIASFSPDEGHRALERLLSRPRAEVGVVRFDARRWATFYATAASSPYLSELTRERPSAGGGGRAPRLRQALERAALDERQPLLERHIAEQVAAVLRLEAPRIDRRAPFPRLGMDSLLSLEVRNRLEASLKLGLSATVMFAYPNIAALAAHLLERLDLPSPQAAEEPHAGEAVDLKALLEAISLEGLRAAGLLDPLLALARQGNTAPRRLAAARDLPSVGGPPLEDPSGGAESAASAPIPRFDPASGAAPLSSGQERLWLFDHLSPRTALYNVHLGLRMQGPLDCELLRRSLSAVVGRHGSFRMTFPVVEGQVVAHVDPPSDVDLDRVDLRALPAERRREELSRLAADQRLEPFDLARGPLWRTTLVALDEGEHLLLWTQHHIVTDGWSLGVFLTELHGAYRALAGGEAPRLTALPVDFVDYAAFQRATLREERLRASLAWWKERLAGLPRLDLPFCRAVASPTHAGDAVNFTLSAGLTAAIKALAARQGCTLFVALLGAWVALLSRYTGQADFPVGTVVAGRSRAELRQLIGFVANTLVLRCDVPEASSFAGLMHRLRDVVVGALEHEDVPFDEVVRAVATTRDGDLNPLFQASFVLENMPLPELAIPGMRWTPVFDRVDGGVEGTAKFNLGLTMAERAEGLSGTLEFATDLFERAAIERMVGHFEVLLRAAVDDPERRVAELELLTEAEKAAFAAWNDTAAEYPPETCVHELFEAQARRTPLAVAVEHEDARITYAELEAQANRLAHHLRALGVGPEALVGLCVERSPSMVVGLLAVLKAGGAYVPLDPAYPAERIAFMLEDTKAKVLLTQASLSERLPAGGARVVRMDADAPAWAALPGSPPESGVRSDNLAYVIYTSGSTGRPKGVALEHRGSVLFLRWTQRAFSEDEVAAVIASTSVSFDVSFFEIFAPLVRGGRIRLLRDVMEVERAALDEARWMLVTVPSAVRALIQEGRLPRQIRALNLAGEALDQRTVDLIFERAPHVERVRDLYGPTEDTTYSTCAVRRAGGRQVIGRPIENTRAYVLDKGLQRTPVGVPGELYLAGSQLARGYLDRPELTAERFIRDPLSGVPGARMYRTGDLARWNEHGELEYLGRIDNQVKLRGFRIELGEIEAALSSHPSVRSCVVVVWEYAPGDRRLVAHVVPSGGECSEGALREHLRAKLPAYMVPHAFEVLASLPTTPNGKVDRKALSTPPSDRLVPASGDALPAAARDALEECLHEVAWRPAEPLAEPSLPRGGAWVVLADQGGVGAALHARLAALGQRCVRVFAGAGYERIEPDLYRIHPARAADYQRLLREVFGEEGRCLGAVHLFGLDAAPAPATTPETLSADLTRGSVSAAHLTQAIVRHGFRDAPRLFLVTRGAQATLGGARVSAAQAPIWGLGKTIALEHPGLKCTRIDLDPAATDADAALLARELGARDREDQIALRGEGRYLGRVVRGRFEAGAGTPFALRSDVSYLVTGGLGRLGLALSRWMVEAGARHLVLVGRRGPGDAARGGLEALQAAGARVLVAQADVAARGDVARVLSTIELEMPPLGGVIHAAGVADDHPLLDLDEERFRRVFAPKALGAWNLHALTEGRPLDFFVMCSSSASLFGAPGEASSSAADAFLDALAQERHAMGLPAMSVQWGAFAEGGPEATAAARRERRPRRGVAPLTLEQGLEALRRLFARPRAAVGVVRFDARQWMELYPGAASLPLFVELAREAASVGGQEAPQIRGTLGRAAPRERPFVLERHVIEQVSRVLRVDEARVDAHAPFKDLGLDSMMSLDVRNRLEASLGVQFSATILFTYPSTAALARYLLDRMDIPADAAPEPGPSAEEISPAVLEDAELLALFDATLEHAERL
uniref:Non-ribosomal peptide synthetase/polyketide synthase n=1 Tax=Sorangium cellulosum TaxID=56 RepID=I0J6Y4_SORCE|nr:non-ribosomal peptide synthetase/polyketide synthase [Sorangium cellulosum]